MEQFEAIKEFSKKQAHCVLDYIKQRKWAQASVAFLGIIPLTLGLWALYAIFKHKGWLPKKSIKDKHVFVTGGGSGLGRRLSELFASKGAVITVSDINLQGADDTVRSIQSKGGKAVAVRCDVSDPDDVRRAAAESVQHFGDVHILVNNAGIVSGKSILENSEKMIKKTLEVNTIAHAYTIRAFLPAMLAKNEGHIVTIASAGGLIGVSGLADYCASKYGAVGFDESIRMELKKRGSGKLRRHFSRQDDLHLSLLHQYWHV